MTSRTRSRTPERTAKIDDETLAVILELWRTPRQDGGRRSYREISRDAAQRGKRISERTVRKYITRAQESTIQEATSRVREKLVENLDVNISGMERVVRFLGDVALTGKIPGVKEPASGSVRVMAAREAIHGHDRILGYLGVQGPRDDLDSTAIADRARQLYGIEVDAEESEEADDGGSTAEEAAPAGGNAATAHH